MSQAADAPIDPRSILQEDLRSDKPFIMKRLVGYAFNRVHDRERAMDIAQEAVARVLEGKGWEQWVFDGRLTPKQNLLSHLLDLARHIDNKERERASERREVAADEDRDQAVADGAPAPTEMPAEWAEHERDMLRAQQVLDRLDEPTREMLRIESESEESLDADALAARIPGWTRKDVYRARERISHHRGLLLEREKKAKTGGST